jgi:hypothetical protein
MRIYKLKIMKILRFSQFINEAETSSGGDKAVVYIGAGTSKSKITDSYAKNDLGVEKDKKYKIEFKNIGHLVSLGKQRNLKVLADQKRIKVEEVGKVDKGEDYLKIGDKEIEGTGELVISKEDVGGKPFVIEASNNGILILYRIANGIREFRKKAGWISPPKPFIDVNDFIVSFTMGTPVSNDESRFSIWAGAWSGKVDNTARRNGFLSNVSSAVVHLGGGKVLDQMSKRANFLKLKGNESLDAAVTYINNSVNASRVNLLKRKFLANSKEVDLKSEIKSFLSDSKNWKSQSTGPGIKVTYTPKGKENLKKLWDKAKDEISKSSKPEGFSDKINPLLPEASKILKSTLGSVYPGLCEDWIERVQRENKYSKAISKSGNMGSGSDDYKEGEF